jgi:hypothetical protein
MKTYLVEHANGTVAVADLSPQQIADNATAARLSRRLTIRLGGMPALLRCRLGENTYILVGPPHLRRFGVEPALETMPSVEVDI